MNLVKHGFLLLAIIFLSAACGKKETQTDIPAAVQDSPAAAVETPEFLELDYMGMANSTGIRVRSAPEISSARVGELNPGDIVHVTKRTVKEETIGSMTNYWIYMEAEYDEAVKGWVFRPFIDEYTGAEGFETPQPILSYEEMESLKMDISDYYNYGITEDKPFDREIRITGYPGLSDRISVIVTIANFTDANHIQKNGYEESEWEIDLKKEYKEYKGMEEGDTGSGGHACYWGGGRYTIVRLGDVLFEELEEHYFPPAMSMTKEYVFFMEHRKISFRLRTGSDDLEFYEEEYRLDNPVNYTDNAHAFLWAFEQFVSEIGGYIYSHGQFRK